MTQETIATNTPGWLAWVGPIGVIMGALWAGARRLLISVTREELAQILREQEEARKEQRAEQHQENLQRFENLYDRMGSVEKGLSRLEGQLSGRYPRINP